MISVNLVDKGIPHFLKFGKKRNLDFISISEMNLSCAENFERASHLYIRKNKILESECEKSHALVLSTYNQSNRPIVISTFGRFL